MASAVKVKQEPIGTFEATTPEIPMVSWVILERKETQEIGRRKTSQDLCTRMVRHY